MRRLFLLLCVLVAAPAHAASPARIEAHTRFLADDLLEGRELGTRGHEVAAAYVAAQFAALGLTPAGTDGWQQRITFVKRTHAGAGETLALTRGGVRTAWANGVDIAVGPSATAGTTIDEAGLVFVGFGLDAPTLGIDDYAGLDVRGKIVVALTGAPLGLDSEVGASLAASKGEAAARRGALGLVGIRTLADVERRPWPKVAASARRAAFNWLSPDGSLDPAAAALKFSATLDDDPAAALFEGAPRSFAQIRAEVSAAPLARPQGFALAGTLRLDRDTRLDRVTSPNIVGLLPGTTPVLRDEVVLLTAHVDHLGVRAHPSGDHIYNGAQDNAVGVTMLIEAARALAAKPPRRSVMFLVTTAEEVGLQGADYFARHPTIALSRIVSEVDLDMPILTCSFGSVVPYGASHSTMGRDVAAVAARMKIGISPDPQPIEAIFTRSDHYRLVRAGIPALFIKTGPGDDRGGNACGVTDKLFRASQYHEPSDDMTLPLDWAAAARFTDLNVALTRRIADARERPRWYVGDFFGETFAPSVVKALR